MNPIAYSIDIETLALTTDAHILQIGFAGMNLKTGEQLVEPTDFWMTVDQPGRRIDPGTVSWWADPPLSTFTQVHVAPPGVQRSSFADVRAELAKRLPQGQDYGLWANHIAFGLGNLRTAFWPSRTPWHYKTEQDLPTIAALLDPSGAVRETIDSVAAHVASADAQWNLEYLRALYKRRQDEVHTLWAYSELKT